MSREYAILERYHLRPPQPNPPTLLTVDPAGGGDATTIRAAMALTASASQAVPYRIYVRNGTYNEIQIDGRDWVTIEGESQDGVVIVVDGLRTDVDPVSGQRYVDMAQSAKHGFFAHHNMVFKRLTIRANDVKYCIHSDGGGSFTLTLDHVRLEHSNGFPHGCGLSGHQNIYWIVCTFVYTGLDAALAYGVYLHNWNNQTAAMYAELNTCTFVGCAAALLTEEGSEQSDLFKLTSCTTDSIYGIRYQVSDGYWNGGGQGKVNVPYNLSVWLVGGNLPLPIDYNASERPNLMSHVVIE